MDKHIEEMAKHCTYHHKGECFAVSNNPTDCDLMCEMFGLFANLEMAGYRKASEVAREIFEEMREELVRYLMLNENIAIKCKEENGEWNAEYWKGKLSAFKQIRGFIDAELKKKYTEDN